MAHADDFPVVTAPCINSTKPSEIKMAKSAGSDQAGSRTCEEMMNGAGDKTKNPGFLKAFDKQIEDYAENMYKGCSLDLTQKSATTLANGFSCQGTALPGATCNVLRNGVPPTFNKAVETDVDHHGRSCGQWPYFDADQDGDTCNITPYYANAGRIRYYSDPPQYIEDAYNRGAFIQALNCFHQQVRNELATRKLRLTDSGHTAMLEALNQAKKAAAATSKKMKTDFGDQANISDIENCTGNEVGTNDDVGKLRQSACQLSAARLAQEGMFMQLAAAEVFSRARKSYEQFIGGSPKQDLVTKAARDALQGKEGKSKDCKSHKVLNNWYKPKYFGLFHQKAARFWNAKVCQ